MSSLIPQTVNSISHYNLRNANDLQTINARKTLYYNSFLPFTIRAWNDLPLEAKQLESVNAFKYFLKRENVPVPKYYYTGQRKVQGTNCSSLNLDLFVKNISDSPMCTCDSIEDAQHYFFHCVDYRQQRTEILNEVSRYSDPSLH